MVVWRPAEMVSLQSGERVGNMPIVAAMPVDCRIHGGKRGQEDNGFGWELPFVALTTPGAVKQTNDVEQCRHCPIACAGTDAARRHGPFADALRRGFRARPNP